MFGGIGTAEIIVLLVVAVILFGRKLPEVAKNVGSSYAQFRKGLSEIQSTIDLDDEGQYNDDSEFEQTYDDVIEPTGPRFEPPTEDEE